MPSSNESPLIAEGERLLRLCNACRYCEGYCAVFPAMERRSAFSAADVNYLANLCHNCGECYYACPYTPPHEYALNLPKTLAEIRVHSYGQYTPGPDVGSAGLARMSACSTIGVAVMVGVAAATGGFVASGANFYSVIPHEAMVATLGIVGVLAALVTIAGFLRFWRDGAAAPVKAGP